MRYDGTKTKRVRLPDWTSDDVERLTAMVLANMGYDDIAVQIGRSRASVCGKVDRLKLVEHQTQSWPAELEDRFRALWDEGLTASQIGARLGVTRSAVCGKRKRLGLPTRIRAFGVDAPARKSRARTHKLAQPPKFRKFKMPAERPQAPQSRNLTLLDLTQTTCRFPHGEGTGILFCGAYCPEELPYCPWHQDIATQRVQPARRPWVDFQQGRRP